MENPYAPPATDGQVSVPRASMFELWIDVLLCVVASLSVIIVFSFCAIGLFAIYLLLLNSWLWIPAIMGAWMLGLLTPELFQSIHMFLVKRRGTD